MYLNIVLYGEKNAQPTMCHHNVMICIKCMACRYLDLACIHSSASVCNGWLFATQMMACIAQAQPQGWAHGIQGWLHGFHSWGVRWWR